MNKNAGSTSLWLAYGLFALAGGLVANSLLGPLVLDTIRYHYSESLINQGIGLDAVALFGAAPMAILAGVLVLRGHRAGPVLAFIPATFAAYMAPQYVVGPDYLGLPGNNEQFFGFHVALFVLAIVLTVVVWMNVDRAALEPRTRATDRRRSLVMFGVTAFIVLGRWLAGVVDLVGGEPFGVDFMENPTAYLLIGVLDLGIVVPAALAAGIGLRRGAGWAREAAFAVVGWFSLVPASVAAMAITMQVNGDPNATTGATVMFGVAAVMFTIGAALLYRPLFAEPSSPARGTTESAHPAGTAALRLVAAGEVSTMEREHSGEGRSAIPMVALTLVIGAALGTTVFAFTQSAVWIGFGAGLGVLVGAILQANRHQRFVRDRHRTHGRQTHEATPRDSTITRRPRSMT